MVCQFKTGAIHNWAVWVLRIAMVDNVQQHDFAPRIHHGCAWFGISVILLRPHTTAPKFSDLQITDENSCAHQCHVSTSPTIKEHKTGQRLGHAGKRRRLFHPLHKQAQSIQYLSTGKVNEQVAVSGQLVQDKRTNNRRTEDGVAWKGYRFCWKQVERQRF